MGAECVAPVLLHQFQNNRGRTSGCLRASFEKNSPRNAPKSLRSNRSLPKQVVSGAAPTSQGVHCNAPALNCCWTLGHQPFTGHLKPSKKDPHPARVIKREGEDAKENATMDKEVELANSKERSPAKMVWSPTVGFRAPRPSLLVSCSIALVIFKSVSIPFYRVR